MSMPLKLKKILQSIKNMQTETITNENGTAVKFADGTMICTLQTKVTDQAIANAYGSLYQSIRVWTFPVPFVERPAVSCSEAQWGTGCSWGSVRGANATTATLRIMDAFQRQAGTNVSISAIAIGRWK